LDVSHQWSKLSWLYSGEKYQLWAEAYEVGSGESEFTRELGDKLLRIVGAP
jgi:hypothetical protein